jgi:hypothetical protein
MHHIQAFILSTSTMHHLVERYVDEGVDMSGRTISYADQVVWGSGAGMQTGKMSISSTVPGSL